MKFLSLLIALCFSFNALAISPLENELKLSMDNFYYQLTVEWDQQNSEFYNEITKNFFEKVEDLNLRGLTVENIVENLKKQNLAPQVSQAIEAKFQSQKPQNINELADFLKINMNQMYATGASWDGDVAIMVGAGVVIVALIGYSIWFSANYQCAEWDYRRKYHCDTTNCYERYCKNYVPRI